MKFLLLSIFQLIMVQIKFTVAANVKQSYTLYQKSLTLHEMRKKSLTINYLVLIFIIWPRYWDTTEKDFKQKSQIITFSSLLFLAVASICVITVRSFGWQISERKFSTSPRSRQKDTVEIIEHWNVQNTSYKKKCLQCVLKF